MLDTKQAIGEGVIRGRDLKMTAAACLYNVTGNAMYENVINAESKVTNTTSAIVDLQNYNQLWATAAYLKTNRTAGYPALFNNMKASIINEAKSSEANYSGSRPSRRATDNAAGYFHTEQNVQRTILAHAVATDQSDKSLLENALVLEADWGLGRNPANIIQMTTASTPLSSKRSIEALYATGQDDGTPGQHPGLTPYLNTDDWASGMVMGRPSWMTAFSYPDNSTWPKAEVYFNTRYVWAHAEFTPQQTMRGKIALYGYLYGIRGATTALRPRIVRPFAGRPKQPGHSSIKINPDGGIRFLVSGADFAARAPVRLFDCSGKAVRMIAPESTSASDLIFRTSSLSKGIYVLKMTRTSERTFHKIALF
jgi:hypothetical protein